MIKLEVRFMSGDGGFSANPLIYTQLKRTDKVAIYQRSKQNGIPYDYEVFLIKVKPKGTVIFNKVVQDDTEQYPSTAQFGRVAWAFNDIGLAMAKFHELTQQTESDNNTYTSDGSDDGGIVIEPSTRNPDPEPSPEDAPVIGQPTNNNSNEKPYKGPTLLIPTGEFSTKQLAEYNNVQYVTAFLFRKELIRTGKIQFKRKQKAAGKGKPTDIFVAV